MDRPHPPEAPSIARGESIVYLMATAAMGLSLVALFGEPGGIDTWSVVGTLASLVVWAVVAGGAQVPLGVFAAATLLPAAVVVLGSRNPGGVFLTLMPVVWVVAHTRCRSVVWPTVGVALALPVALGVLERSNHETGAVYFVGGVAISCLAGVLLRRQKELVWALGDALDQLGEAAAAEERRRIAHEVHDIVAHSLTVVLLNVTGARRALQSAPAQAEEALARAEEVGRESLEHVRRTVGLLKEDADVDPRQPLPGIGDLDALVERYRSAGLDVVAELDGTEAVQDPATGTTLYRIVAEALANAQHHSPGAPVTVHARVGRNRLRLSVVNGAPAPGAVSATRRPDGQQGRRRGLGLDGMTERARGLGGNVAAGPTPEGGWEVAVELPAPGARARRAVPT